MDVRQRNGVTTSNTSQQRSVTENMNSTTAGRIPSSTRIGNSSSSKFASSKSNRTSMTSFCLGFVMAIVIIALGVFTDMVSVTYNNKSSDIATTPEVQPQQQLTQLTRGLDDSGKPSMDELRQKKELESMRKHNKDLEEELKTMKKLMADSKNVATIGYKGDNAATTTIESLQKRIDRFIKMTQRLKDMIQLISKHHLIEKYGIGPHYVEMLLSFDPQSNIADPNRAPDDTAILVIEMAPITEMPATVYWFLEQINATIYNGASFHRNAHHVVQGGVIQNFESKKGATQRIMELIHTTGFDSIPFQEYSPNFPHVKYTLGYAGRPGGPDFYVSTEDNTRNHGPGGQSSYEEASEADPCFAKVVPGYEHVVDRMHKSKVQPGNYMRMQHYVAIRHMRLLPPNEIQQLTQIK